MCERVPDAFECDLAQYKYNWIIRFEWDLIDRIHLSSECKPVNQIKKRIRFNQICLKSKCRLRLHFKKEVWVQQPTHQIKGEVQLESDLSDSPLKIHKRFVGHINNKIFSFVCCPDWLLFFSLSIRPKKIRLVPRAIKCCFLLVSELVLKHRTSHPLTCQYKRKSFHDTVWHSI